MSKPSQFKEYIWLLNTIRRAGKISFEELNEKWLDTEMSEGNRFPRLLSVVIKMPLRISSVLLSSARQVGGPSARKLVISTPMGGMNKRY